MTKSKTLAMINAIVYGVMVFINIAFQNTETTTASVSDKYLSLLTPSGITFMIWIIIFGLLLVYTAKDLLSDKENDIGLLYLLSSILNITWVIVWHYELIFVSLIVIIALAFTLGLIVKKISNSENLLTKITFSMYYAWVSVASVVSIFVLFTSINQGTYDVPVVRLLSGLALCLLVVPMYMNKSDLTYILVYVWAIVGVITRHMTTFNYKYMELLITAFVVLLASGGFIWNFFNERRKVRV